MEINIKQISQFPKGVFNVGVTSDETTEHIVELSEVYYKQLTSGKITTEELIKRSFEFLLKRESNTSILSSFELSVINNYFPEYENMILNSINN